MMELLPWHRPGALVVFTPVECWRQRAELFALFGNRAPTPGQVCTIREVVVTESSVGFRLEEVRNRTFDLHDRILEEPIFNVAEFRPARIGSIESLAALLCPPREVKRHVFGEIAEEAFAEIEESVQ